jgi:hypothetical protein
MVSILSKNSLTAHSLISPIFKILLRETIQISAVAGRKLETVFSIPVDRPGHQPSKARVFCRIAQYVLPAKKSAFYEVIKGLLHFCY